MGEFTYENNKKGPFNISKGSSYNAECPTCKTPTWFCEYPYQTMSVGMRFIDNKGKTVGVIDLNGNVYCKDCYPDKENML